MTQLSELVLHPKTKESIDRVVAALPHALIIEGSTGIGVSTTAKAIAEAVGAVSFIVTPKKKVKNDYIDDFQDGSVIIEDIRRLYEQTRSKQSDKHVYIIDTGEKSMTHSAQNAFLKLLEEPRPGLHFIIATHQFDQLLPTIVSRSQRISMQPVTVTQTNVLIDSLGITDDTKHTRLAFVGRGLPALTLRLVHDDKLYEDRVAIMKDAKTMLSGDTYEKMTTIHRYRDTRADTLTLLDDMNHQLRTILRSNPDSKLVKIIECNLTARQRIAANGNIRLHLASAVL